MMRIGPCVRLKSVTRRCDERPIIHLLRRQFVWSSPIRENASHQVRQIRAQARKRKDFKLYDYSSDEATFARHVLRTILRECTYLPDRFAADYIKHHALARFRANAYKAWKDRGQFETQYKTRRKEARQVTSTLQRANEGERDCLLKVLNTAYGRIGKRRHELMRPLLHVKGMNETSRATVDSDTTASENEDAFVDNDDGSAIETPTPHPFPKLTVTTPLDLTPQLRTLLNSQIRIKPPVVVRSNPKRIEPIIPELNSWHRPMPQKRIRNARHKQYAHLLERVQVPLPTEEWERLRELALGKVQPELPLPRRRKAEVSVFESGSADETPKGSEFSALEVVTRYGRPPEKAIKKSEGRTLSPRFLQRLYAEVFSQCPLLEWSNVANDWKVTWGFQVLLNVNQMAGEVEGAANKASLITDTPIVQDTKAPELSTIQNIG